MTGGPLHYWDSERPHEQVAESETGVREEIDDFWTSVADDEEYSPSEETSSPAAGGSFLASNQPQDVPILMVAKPHSNAGLIPPLLRQIRSQCSHVPLGVVVPLSAANPGDYLRQFKDVELKLADPVSYRYFDHESAGSPNPLTTTRFGYQNPINDTLSDDWVKLVCEAQAVASPDALLTTGKWMSGADHEREIARAMEELDIVKQQKDASQVAALNLTLDGIWLSQLRHRTALLEELVQAGPSIVYLRVLWRRSAHNYASLTEPAVLEGYIELASTLQDEGIRVILPDTDLTGWFLCGFGVAGFGSGMTSGARAFRPAQGGGGAGNPRRPRFLQAELLHTVLRDEHVMLKGIDARLACRCTYCVVADRQGRWTPRDEGPHHLIRLAELISQFGAHRDRLAVVRDRVTAAVATLGTVQSRVALTADSRPNHLSVWQSLT